MPLDFLGAIGKALRKFSQAPGAMKLGPQRPELPLAERYAKPGQPLDLISAGTDRFVRGHQDLRQYSPEMNRVLVRPPHLKYELEQMPITGAARGTDPLDARLIGAINAMHAKTLGDELFVPRAYYTAWDQLADEGAYDRNVYGGLTLRNMLRKPAYLQSYLLRKGAAPQVEGHPHYLKAAEFPGEPHDPWKYAELGHDEQRYGGLGLLREYMEASALPHDTVVPGQPSWYGGYARGWEGLTPDEQVGALGLSEAGAMSRLLKMRGLEGRHEQGLWDPFGSPQWEDTLGRALSGYQKEGLAQYGIGPATLRRVPLTDWLYHRARRGDDLSSTVIDKDAEAYLKGMFYAQGGLAKLAGGGLPKSALRLLQSLPRASRGAVLGRELPTTKFNQLRRLGEDELLLAHGSDSNFATPRATAGNPFYLTDDPAFALQFRSANDDELLLPYLHLFNRPAGIPTSPFAETFSSLDDDAASEAIKRLGLMKINEYSGWGVGFGPERGAAEIIASPRGVKRLRRYAGGGLAKMAGGGVLRRALKRGDPAAWLRLQQSRLKEPVYHGSITKAIEKFNDPAFFTTARHGAENYADGIWVSDEPGVIYTRFLDTRNPFSDVNQPGQPRPWEAVAKRAGIPYKIELGAPYRDYKTGKEYPSWDFHSPAISDWSPFEGTNTNDLMYIPQFRKALQDMGYDAWHSSDVLFNDEIPLWIPVDAEKQLIKIPGTYAGGGLIKLAKQARDLVELTRGVKALPAEELFAKQRPKQLELWHGSPYKFRVPQVAPRHVAFSNYPTPGHWMSPEEDIAREYALFNDQPGWLYRYAANRADYPVLPFDDLYNVLYRRIEKGDDYEFEPTDAFPYILHALKRRPDVQGTMINLRDAVQGTPRRQDQYVMLKPGAAQLQERISVTPWDE